MKKVFAIAALATVLVSCDDSKKAADEVNAADSTATSTATEVAASADSTLKAGADSINAAMPAADSTKK